MILAQITEAAETCRSHYKPSCRLLKVVESEMMVSVLIERHPSEHDEQSWTRFYDTVLERRFYVCGNHLIWDLYNVDDTYAHYAHVQLC